MSDKSRVRTSGGYRGAKWRDRLPPKPSPSARAMAKKQHSPNPLAGLPPAKPDSQRKWKLTQYGGEYLTPNMALTKKRNLRKRRSR